MKNPRAVSIGLSAFLFLSLFSPSPLVSKSSGKKDCGEIEGHFRGRFWHFYLRGNSYAECEMWAEAEADYREAIKERPGDQFMAKTYGMNFIDYFPHRELGIVLFKQGKMEEAKKELELSYSQVESGRTASYLNEINKEESTADKEPPVIRILSPAAGELSSEFKIKIRGEAEDVGLVAVIAVNGIVVPLELAEEKKSFETDVVFERGRHKIVVEVWDLAGNSSSAEVWIAVDRDGPELAIDDLSVPKPGVLRVKGMASDASGVKSFVAGGTEIPAEGGKEVSFTRDLPFTGRGVQIKLIDLAGNETVGWIEPPGPEPTRGTWLWEGKSYASLRLTPLPDAALTGRYFLAAGTGPSIKLDDDNVGDTHMGHVVVGGMVSSPGNQISEVTVAGEPVLTKPGKVVYFSSRVDLKDGPNTIAVEARDSTGAGQKRQVKANYLPPTMNNLKSRLSVGIKPLKAPEAARLAYIKIQQALSEQDRFLLVEQEQMEAIFTEFEISQSDLADPNARLELKKRMTARCMLFIDVVSGEELNIVARLVDTETTVTLFVTDAFAKGKDPRSVEEACRRLAWKICQGYPLIEGVVVDVTGKVISTDLTRKMGIKLGMQVIVFELGKEKIHPKTGKSLGRATIELGAATISAVQQDYSDAQLASGVNPAKIKPGMSVITR